MPVVDARFRPGLMVGTAELQVGESWAYRARHVDVVEVEVLKLGTQRPARVLVRFVDERFEGRQEWVSPARLKVRWSAVGAFLESKARWDRIFELGVGLEDPGDGAANQVFDTLIDRGIARMEYREADECRITDSHGLTTLTDVEPAAWEHCPDAFREGQDLVAPWPITEKSAARAEV